MSTTRIRVPWIGFPSSVNSSVSVVVSTEKFWEKTTPDDVSDIPHDGRIAVRGKPECSSMRRNRRAMRGTIASPPLRMNRKHVRSNRSALGASANRSAIRPNAKLGAHVLVTR